MASPCASVALVTPHDGLTYQGQLIRQMLVTELTKLVEQNPAGFSPEMVSKAQHAVAACNAGIPRVHVINGTLDEGLLAEVFSSHGLGTLIYANEYENIRPARKKDVRSRLCCCVRPHRSSRAITSPTMSCSPRCGRAVSRLTAAI